MESLARAHILTPTVRNGSEMNFKGEFLYFIHVYPHFDKIVLKYSCYESMKTNKIFRKVKNRYLNRINDTS